MRLLFSSVLLLLLILSIDGQDSVAEIKCGISTPIKDDFNHRGKRIIGGNKVPVGKWPWQVAINTTDVKIDENSLCGGTIIADRWILTAAHCFDLKVPTSIMFGRVDWPKEDNDNIVHYKNLIIHESYQLFGVNHDIALIELDDPIPFDETASPICLPSSDTILPEDGQVIATGFGAFNDRTDLSIPPVTYASPNLLETAFPLIPRDVCYKRESKLKDTQICGGSFGHGTGHGDSGGPAVMFSKSERWFQVGITSYGGDDITQDISPGVYTNVGKYCDWIEKNTRGAATCQDAELVDATKTH